MVMNEDPPLSGNVKFPVYVAPGVRTAAMPACSSLGPSWSGMMPLTTTGAVVA